VVFGVLLGGVREVDFFATGARAPPGPARVPALDFRAVFLEVARGAFFGVAFFLAVFFEVFLLLLRSGRARPAAVVFFEAFLTVVFFDAVVLRDDFLDVFLAVVFLRAALGLLDVLLAVFLAGVLFAAVFLRAADVFFLPDVFFAGAMAAGR
jgi:hypothetical protein